MSKKSSPPSFLKGLDESDPTKVIKALGTIRKRGDHRAVLPMLRLFVEREEPEVITEITDILNTLKVKRAIPELFLGLEEDDLRPARKTILSAIWNSGLAVSDRLPHLIEVALDGDFEETFECITIIENQEEAFPDVHVTDAMIALRSYLQDQEGDGRTALLDGLLLYLEESAAA